MNLEKRLAALEARLMPNQNLVWLAAFCNASRANPAAVEKLRILCANYRGSGRPNSAKAYSTYQLLYTPATGAEGDSNFRYSSAFTFNRNTATATLTGSGCYTVKISLNHGTVKMTKAVQLK